MFKTHLREVYIMMIRSVYHDDSVWHWIKNLYSTKERADRRSREKSGTS